MSNQLTQLRPQSGVKRDGTPLDSNYCADAVWCRFLNGKPRKMGGYRRVAQFTGAAREVHVYNKLNGYIVHNGSQNKLEAVLLDYTGAGSAVYDRTPTSFVGQTDYLWSMDTAYDLTGSGAVNLYAYAGRNLTYSDNSVLTPIFYGDIGSASALQPIVLTDATKPATTGGITVGTTALVLALATGFAVGDLIRVVGAGVAGKDLYTTITALAGVNATLLDAAGTTVVGAAVDHLAGTDGGIVTIGPYLFYYGSNGLIGNSSINNPFNMYTSATGSNRVNPVGTKVVKGLAIRGGSNAPSGLFWSMDSLIRVSYTGGTALFNYDIVSSQSSILSQNCVIEYDGVYYWLGTDRALMYNGVVREIPNQLNNQWFYNNLNWQYRNKVYATKVPRYGEIWWFFPKGTSTFCNWALVYNIRENTWYDTPITRSCGYYTQTFNSPLWADEQGKLWQQEFGYDSIDGSVVTSILSSFTSHNIGYPIGGALGDNPQGANAWTRMERIEPDFIQIGDMTLDVLTQEYANSPQVDAHTQVFTENQERIDFRVQGRIINLKFTSNVINGFYNMGVVLMHMDLGDRRE